MKWCDNNNNVIKWNSEGFQIPYYSKLDNKNRRYIIDFWVQYSDGKQYLIEIKPEKQTSAPKAPKNKNKKAIHSYLYECYMWGVNKDKWTAAEIFATKKDMTFMIYTEKKLRNLGIAV